MKVELRGPVRRLGPYSRVEMKMTLARVVTMILVRNNEIQDIF